MIPDIPAELRTLIRESGKNVRQISDESGISYHKLIRLVNEQTTILDVTLASELCKHLTGKEPKWPIPS